MGENNCTAVWFNEYQVDIYEILFRDGVIAETFAGFVKRAFHDHIEKLLLKKDNFEIKKHRI